MKRLFAFCMTVLLWLFPLCSCNISSVSNGSDSSVGCEISSQESVYNPTYEEIVEEKVGKSRELSTALNDIYNSMISNVVVANEEYSQKCFSFIAVVTEIYSGKIEVQLLSKPFVEYTQQPNHSGIMNISAEAPADTIRKITRGGVYQFVGEIKSIINSPFFCICMENLYIVDDAVEISVYCDDESPWADYTFNYTAYHKFIFNGKLDGDYIGKNVKMRVRITNREVRDYKLNGYSVTCLCYSISEILSIEEVKK